MNHKTELLQNWNGGGGGEGVCGREGGGFAPPPPPSPWYLIILKKPWLGPWGVGGGGGGGAECMRMEGTSEAAPETVRQALGGGCQSGWGGCCRLQMPLSLVLGVRGTVAGHRLGALEGGGVARSPRKHQCAPALSRKACGRGAKGTP